MLQLPRVSPINDRPAVWAVAALLAISIGAVYIPVLSVPFIYDDNSTIVENTSIVSLWPLFGPRAHPGPLNPPPDLPTSGRPLVNLSLAVNYYFGGLNPIGYHALNVAIHFLAALLLWAIVRRTLRLPYFAGSFAISAGWLALAVAMLWALHPLQTEAVIYATQRTELMMAFFYLATMYCSLRYWSALPLPLGEGRGEGALDETPNKRRRLTWLTLAVFACLAGMASKEVMVSAPLMVLLFERTFVAGSLAKALRRSWPLYVGLAATWILLLALILSAPHGKSAGFGLGVPAYVWWLTQTKVLLMYLKLAIWPWPLLIHYELPHLNTFGEAWMYVLPVLLLAAATFILLWRNHPVGFLGAWVFAILAPTCIVPVITEFAAERRMYLPLVAIVVLAVVGGWSLAGKWKNAGQLVAAVIPSRWLVALPALLAAIAFVLVDVKHLDAFRDEPNLWRNVIRYQPENLIARINLADALIHAGRSSEAIDATRAMLALEPDHPIALNNLGVALTQAGQYPEAIENLKHAVRVMPDYADAHSNLGLVLSNTGHHLEAIQELQAGLALKRNDPNTLYNLGIALTHLGRYPEAIENFERALRIRPGFKDAHVNLGVALAGSGKNPQAIEQLRLALLFDPNDANCHNNMGLLLASAGRIDEAIGHFAQALRLRPDRADVHNNLGQMCRRTNRPLEAIEHFQTALRLKPDDWQACFNLAQALAITNQSPEAIATAQKAIDFARRSEQQAAAKQIEDWLQLYQAELRRGGAATPNSPTQ